MRDIFKYILFCLIIMGTNSYCFEPDNKIKAIVENFCLSEFQGGRPGDEDRDIFINYSDEKLKKFDIEKCSEKSNYPEDRGLDCIPLYLVSSYKVTKIDQTDSTHAYAIINYQQLARTEGWGNGINENNVRKLIKDIHKITVKLNLEYVINKKDSRKDGWRIINPEYPKISIDSMVKYYDKAVSINYSLLTKGLKYHKLSPSDKIAIKKAYDHEKPILDFLIDLKK